MWIIVGIFVVVFGAMTYSIVMHRKSVGHKAEQFHENITVEIVWTIIPFFILIGMALPATKTIIAMKDTSSPDITIKATGYQWKWGYDYLQEGISFYSTLSTPREQIEDYERKGTKKDEHYLLEVDNPVVVPVGKKVRIITTANDVIHSWWVPALGIKQDAIPGFVRDTWFKADKPGHLPRPVRRAVRQGPRLHADRGGGGGAREVRRVGRRAEEEDGRCGAGPRQAMDARRAEGPRREGLRRQLRRLPPADRHGRAGHVPGAVRLQDRDRAEGSADQRSC